MVSEDHTQRERTEHGNYAEEYPPDQILDLFDGREPLTAREVADELGCTRPTAFGKLTGLDQDGKLRTKKVGARARVWWLPAANVCLDCGFEWSGHGADRCPWCGSTEVDA